MENISPKQITVPNGPQSGEPLNIMGITPTAAAADVKNMGRIRLLPAALADSLMLKP